MDRIVDGFSDDTLQFVKSNPAISVREGLIKLYNYLSIEINCAVFYVQ